MTYKIECFIEKIDSKGKFTFLGLEGYYLEKGDNAYNVLWPKKKKDIGVTLLPVKQKISLPKGCLQKDFLLLVSARTSHSKVELVFEKASDNNDFTLKNFSLI